MTTAPTARERTVQMMNKRYTDIDALVAMLRNNIDLPFNGGDNWAHIVQIKDKLIEHIEKNAPVADVAGVVRCKECKHYNKNCMSPHSGWCECLERGEYDEHFCSHGERKDGDNNVAD